MVTLLFFLNCDVILLLS